MCVPQPINSNCGEQHTMEYWLDKLSQVDTPYGLSGERRRAMAALILCNDFTHVQQLEHADSAEKWNGAEAHTT